MNEMVTKYEVVGTPIQGEGELVLRRFDDETDAVNHALNVDMGVWDDVFVRPVKQVKKRDVSNPPPMPWTVEWSGSFAYVLDADGYKLASLLGPQQQREHVAAILCELKP